MTGVVSACLEEEVKSRVARHGIVVWLDKDGHYSAFVDDLARRSERGDNPYPILAYRGSFLQLMLALERYGSGLDPERLLVHLPGYGSAASVADTPLLELYKAGHHFSKALPTLVSEAAAGRVTPDELTAYLESPGLSLSGADAWLEQRLGGGTPGIVQRLEALQLTHVVDGLLGADRFLVREIPPAGAADLASHLHRHVGMDAAWLTFYLGRSTELRVLDVGEALGGFLLSVEYVFDLKRDPVSPALRRLKELPKPLVERCLGLVQHYRAQHPDAYEHTADEAETHVSADAEEATAEELGKIDTFRFEEAKIREAAIRAGQTRQWKQALEWAKQRSEVAFWLDRDRRRRWAWTLIEHAAALGDAIDRTASGLREARSLGDALEYYAEKAYVVDAAHRRLEQRFHETPGALLPEYDKLLEVISNARRAYRTWADELARAFTRLCRSYGALPDAMQQQRNIFDRVVRPLARDGEKVALFLIDAFRFEMGKEMEAEIKRAGTAVEVQAWFAELPTITDVGMNVLAPVVSGDRVSPVITKKGFGGFRWNEFTVDSPDTRARAMGSGATQKAVPLLKLADVRSMPGAQLQKIVKAAPNVLIVHSLELDNAGEKGFGPATFASTLQHIREAWLHLSQAGVKSFVFTGDHGFLLQDLTADEKPYGRPTEPDRRFVLEEHALTQEGMFTVPLSALRYDVSEERYLLFREDTAVWKTLKSGAPFVHGGNSLQERVIPVLVVRRQRERGGTDTVYEVQVEAMEDNLGRRRLRLKLRLAPFATGALAFTGAGQVTLGIRVKGRPDVEVTIIDIEGAELRGGLMRVPVKADWTTVYFQLEGDIEERVQVEVFHPDGVEKIEPATVTGWFAVSGRTRQVTSPPPAPAPGTTTPPPLPVGIEDEGFRRVFEHLDQYGSVNESELDQMLGGPRRVRAFSRQFDELLKRVPFRVRIDTTGVMKCYVKESG